MFVNDKFVYIHLPKTGGSFISTFLKEHVGGEYQQTSHNKHVKARSINKKNRFEFGSIRNPWDWYVSFYEFNLTRTPYTELMKPTFAEFLKYSFEKTQGNLLRLQFETMHKINIGLLTYHYILFFCDEVRVLDNFVDGFPLLIDRVIKFESLLEELPAMFMQYLYPLSTQQKEKLGEMLTAKINPSQRLEKYQDYYTSQTKEWVAEKERFIINAYNYKF